MKFTPPPPWERFNEDVICDNCGRIIGYAPYYRTEYVCKDCKGDYEREKKKGSKDADPKPV